jgi:hypothetical protein
MPCSFVFGKGRLGNIHKQAAVSQRAFQPSGRYGEILFGFANALARDSLSSFREILTNGFNRTLNTLVVQTTNKIKH